MITPSRAFLKKPPRILEREVPVAGPGDVLWHNYPAYSLQRFFNRPGKFSKIVAGVNEYSDEYKKYSDKSVAKNLLTLRRCLSKEGVTLQLTCQTFALVREQAGRYLGMRHHKSQLIGGWVMLNGMVAEMETGEGKTLTATLTACTAALAGIPVHIVTVNDYLAVRDAELMKPLYESLGLTVAAIDHAMTPMERKKAYGCDVVYCTNKELVFDYLKDRLKRPKQPAPLARAIEHLSGSGSHDQCLLTRGLCFALVDEADSIFIDEAVTPLIISGGGKDNFSPRVYRQALGIAEKLTMGIHFTHEAKNSHFNLTDRGAADLDKFGHDYGGIWASKRQSMFLVETALKALHDYHKSKEYIVKENSVQIVDSFTGRILADRSWENGLHQMIECKEGCPITHQRETLAKISYQRFFRRYHILAGMSGTAREVRREIWKVYGLQVVTVESHKPTIRRKIDIQCVLSEQQKYRAIIQKVKSLYAREIPVLIGTPVLGVSEQLASLLQQEGLPFRLLNALQNKKEAEIIALAGQRSQITVATNMAGRGTDIKLGEGVAERGGLYVIATEMQASKRIDRQLFGRCGRQGDPGAYQLFISLEDELFSVWKSSYCMFFLKKSLRLPQRLCRPLISFFAGYAQLLSELKGATVRQRMLKQEVELETGLALSEKRD